MSHNRPTYREMADRLNRRLCSGLRPNGQYCLLGDHHAGFMADGEVHWSGRLTTYPSIRRFLLMVARDGRDTDGDPEWLRFYRDQMVLNAMAQIARVRIPRRLSLDDRARMAELLVGVPRSEPYRERARQWAKRRNER